MKRCFYFLFFSTLLAGVVPSQARYHHPRHSHSRAGDEGEASRGGGLVSDRGVSQAEADATSIFLEAVARASGPTSEAAPEAGTHRHSADYYRAYPQAGAGHVTVRSASPPKAHEAPHAAPAPREPAPTPSPNASEARNRTAVQKATHLIAAQEFSQKPVAKAKPAPRPSPPLHPDVHPTASAAPIVHPVFAQATGRPVAVQPAHSDAQSRKHPSSASPQARPVAATANTAVHPATGTIYLQEKHGAAARLATAEELHKASAGKPVRRTVFVTDR